MNFPMSLDFNDIAIEQRKMHPLVKSRMDVDIRSEIFRDFFCSVPIISANMSTVTGADLAISLHEAGGLGVLHRVGTMGERVTAAKTVLRATGHCATSIGLGTDEQEAYVKLLATGVDIFFVDVAHGYCDEVISMCKWMYYRIGDRQVWIIIGNTTNPQIISEVDEYVDAIKIGIGSGLSCLTKNTAGCFKKQFSAVYDFYHVAKKYGMPIISDGGIREPADFVKAIAAGAHSVMAGSIFAQCPESSAKTVTVGTGVKKIYSGMASKEITDKLKSGAGASASASASAGSTYCEEGTTILLDVGEPVRSLVNRYAGALRSGISYAGGNDIKSFHENVAFIRI